MGNRVDVLVESGDGKWGEVGVVSGGVWVVDERWWRRGGWGVVEEVMRGGG